MTWTVDPSVLADLRDAAQHDAPPRATDSDALAQLEAMLRAAAEELGAIEADIVAVGSAPGKFNDAGWEPWAFVRVDDEIAEDDGYDVGTDFDALVADSSEALRRAADVRARLEDAGWRECWTRAFSLPFDDEFLALVIERGVPWLLYASSNSGAREHVFSLWEPSGLSYVGECVERMDQRLADPDEADPFTIRLRVDEER